MHDKSNVQLLKNTTSISFRLPFLIGYLFYKDIHKLGGMQHPQWVKYPGDQAQKLSTCAQSIHRFP